MSHRHAIKTGVLLADLERQPEPEPEPPQWWADAAYGQCPELDEGEQYQLDEIAAHRGPVIPGNY